MYLPASRESGVVVPLRVVMSMLVGLAQNVSRQQTVDRTASYTALNAFETGQLDIIIASYGNLPVIDWR